MKKEDIPVENRNLLDFFEFEDTEQLHIFSLKQRFGDIPESIMFFKKSPELMKLIDGDDISVRKLKRKASKDKSKTQLDLKFSTYNPDQANFIIQYYTDENYRVLDPFMGRFTRPITNLYNNRKYVGFDICPDTVQANAELLAKRFPEASESYKLYNESGIHLRSLESESESFDAVFSCPPYYDTEQYSGEEGDISYYSREEFDKSIDVLFENLYRLIKKSEYDNNVFYPVIFTVGSQRHGNEGIWDMDYSFQTSARKAGFVLHDKLFTKNLAPMKFFDAQKSYNKRRVIKNYETTLVFVKY